MSPIQTRQRIGLIIACLFCLVLPACGNKKMTQANFDKITVGMSLADVEAILGPGKKDDSGDGSGVAMQAGVFIQGAEKAGGRGVDTYVWESGDKVIKVFINNGKVSNKQASGLEAKKK
jgi:hypothetical protein